MEGEGNISRYRGIFQIYFEIVIEEEGGLDKKWTSKDIDENDEEEKNIDFWKILEIAIEKEKKRIN